MTSRVLADAVLMRTLEDSQSGGEKHAVIALVEHGVVRETYVSPESSREKELPLQRGAAGLRRLRISDGVCLLIVRDGKAVISINGLR